MTSEGIRVALQQALDELRQLVQQGLYQELELLDARVISVPRGQVKPNWAWAVVRYKQSSDEGGAHQKDQVGHIALRTAAGYFNKVRYTYPAHFNTEAGFAMFTSFLSDWQRAVETAAGDSLHAAPEVEPASRTPAAEAIAHAFGYLNPALAQNLQRDALAHYADLGDPSLQDPAHATGEALHHELGHVLLAGLENEMALSVNSGGAARKVDLRAGRTVSRADVREGYGK